ncbi:universal stress protein [Arthrobacter cryoconiti]|uniref:Universal stress protein n=1 Tax=Arthrobacter cryoconiti TaxID=748907 RepID=A0ABV8R3M8_9MICC|nr:universal stress protein [Arthrobacter cryoconiti]
MTGPLPPKGGPNRITRPVLVGIMPTQPLAVARRAAQLAYSLDVELVCAYVDITRYLVEEATDGSVASEPIDSDGVDDDAEGVSATISQRLSSVFSAYGVSWSYRSLAGDPARALGRLAETLDASMIVVGTRERGVGHRLEELLTGSVAVHLAHRQHRPVVVIPLKPQALGAEE